MQIDWLTVIAQIVNFLVLVWLLKRFLYAPVVRIMAQREQRVAERLEQAGLRETQAGEARASYEEQLARLQREREALLRQAREEVRREQQAMLESARVEAAAHRARWHEELAREREDLLKALRRQVAESAVSVARRALAGVADAGLEPRTVWAFLRELEALSEQDRAALAEGRGPVEVCSAFELDESLRTQIVHALQGIVGESRPVRFRHDPALLQGVELTSDGRRLSWSFGGFLEEVQRELAATLREASGKG